MSLDNQQRLAPEILFAGAASKPHSFWNKNTCSVGSKGKERMYSVISEVIRGHHNGLNELRLASLPGKFWRFEFRLQKELSDVFNRFSFTGFERDENVILSGAAYVPRVRTRNGGDMNVTGFREITALNTTYYRTNCARWLHLDVNDALTLTEKHFDRKHILSSSIGHRWFFNKFCRWTAIWFDYYGPPSVKMGEALANLHWHCDTKSSIIPVAISVMKGRGHINGVEIKSWLESKLAGDKKFPGVGFTTITYFEYQDEGTTMANIVGFITR